MTFLQECSLVLIFCQERAKKGEGEARSAGLEDESVGNAVSGRRRRQKSCRMDDVEQGYVSD